MSRWTVFRRASVVGVAVTSAPWPGRASRRPARRRSSACRRTRPAHNAPASPAAASSATSAAVVTPPEAITGVAVAACIWRIAADVGPGEHSVGRDVGVYDRRHRRSLRTAEPSPPPAMLLVSSQPSVATMPCRASTPRASRSGNLAHISRNHSGCLSADVPSTNRDRPNSSSDSMVASSRMPPPSSHSMSTASRIVRTASRLTGRPARAPSRSTRCKCRAPASSNCWATPAGLSEKTVSRA